MKKFVSVFLTAAMAAASLTGSVSYTHLFDFIATPMAATGVSPYPTNARFKIILAKLIKILFRDAGIPIEATPDAIRSPILKSLSLMERDDFFLRK